MRSKGRITSWNDDKGYGFITPSSGEKQVFIHIKSITNLKNRHRSTRPEVGQLVTYALSKDKQGRICAEKSLLSGKYYSTFISILTRSIPVISSLAFFSAVGLAVYMAKIPPFIFAFYLIFSLITFSIYAFDKSAARQGHWRTKENSLHLLSLIGGWPGALLAQKLMRHKTRKQPFQTLFWITTGLNGALFIWLLTPQGQSALQLFIDAIVWVLTTGID